MGCGCKEKKVINEKRENELKEKTGGVAFDDTLTRFLYELLLNHLTAGEMEELVVKTINNKDTNFNNGWLAKYANSLANELTNAKTNKLQSLIDEAFGNSVIKETNEPSNEFKMDQEAITENEKIIDGLLKSGQISAEEAEEMKKELSVVYVGTSPATEKDLVETITNTSDNLNSGV